LEDAERVVDFEDDGESGQSYRRSPDFGALTVPARDVGLTFREERNGCLGRHFKNGVVRNNCLEKRTAGTESDGPGGTTANIPAPEVENARFLRSRKEPFLGKTGNF
jgi:hypothetical protein